MRIAEEVTGQKITLRESVKPSVGKWDVVCGYYLELYSMCKEFRTLPRSGGWEDQDWLVCHFFGVISAAFHAHIAKHKAAGARK